MREPGAAAHPARDRPVWVGSLLWPKLLLGRRASGRQLLTRGFFLIAGVGIGVAIYAASSWFLGLCYAVETVGPLLCRRLLDLTLMVLLSVLLLSNIVTALSSFFLARDLELLVSAPIPPRSLFAARFGEQMLQSSWMVLAFALPTLLAFAKVAGGGWTYLALAAALPPLLVFPAAAGLALALLLVRYMPAARVRDIVMGLMFVVFVVLYVVIRVLEPEQLLDPDSFASVVHLLASLSAPSSAILPSHWATALTASTFRDATGGAPWLIYGAALWTGAGASYVISSALFRSVYGRAFSRTQEGRGVAHLARWWAWLRRRPLPADGPLQAPGRRAPGVDPLRLMGRLVPRGPAREFLVKDLKLLFRDASQWSQLVLLLALVFVYLYNFRHFRSMGEDGLIDRLALVLVGMGLSGFVTTAVSVRFAFPLISLEGRMLWLLRSAPMRARQILWSKLLSTLPPLLAVAEILSAASLLILGARTGVVLLGAAVAALTAISVSAISIGLGAVLPERDAESAAKVAASFGGLVCMSVALVVAIGLVFLAIYPAYVLHFGMVPRLGRLAVSVAGALLLTATATAGSLWLGARALER